MRIIPARAGPTVWPARTASSWPDHPRSCGANLMTAWTYGVANGSSPLVRGQRVDLVLDLALGRIIPARAGPTCDIDTYALDAEDHPRSCGANCSRYLIIMSVIGSSPLVRGQPVRGASERQQFRIIPARAGPTFGSSPRNRPSKDHPRSCGAN